MPSSHGHSRTTSMDSQKSRHSLLHWLRKGGHGRSQSLDQQLVGTPWKQHHKRTGSVPADRQYLAQMQARSPVITSASMLHRRAASMDVLVSSRPYPLPPSRRDQAIEQTRVWQRELDAADARWRERAAARVQPPVAESDSSSTVENDLSKVWESFLNHLEDSHSILPVDDADLQSLESDTDSEAPVTPQIGYLEPRDEVLVGLGLGYLSWSGKASAQAGPLKLPPRRCSSMAAIRPLDASCTSSMIVLADSTNSTLRKSQTSIGLAVTNESKVKALPRRRSAIYPQLHLSRCGVPAPRIYQDDEDATVCFGVAM